MFDFKRTKFSFGKIFKKEKGKEREKKREKRYVFTLKRFKIKVLTKKSEMRVRVLGKSRLCVFIGKNFDLILVFMFIYTN